MHANFFLNSSPLTDQCGICYRRSNHNHRKMDYIIKFSNSTSSSFWALKLSKRLTDECINVYTHEHHVATTHFCIRNVYAQISSRKDVNGTKHIVDCNREIYEENRWRCDNTHSYNVDRYWCYGQSCSLRYLERKVTEDVFVQKIVHFEFWSKKNIQT